LYDDKKKERLLARYAAFVLLKGGEVRRVELGDAAPIEEALTGWRAAIAEKEESKAAALLRERLWDKLAEALPAETETVYLATDGPLAELPWGALPGKKPGTVLLEEMAVALVPDGPFLLEQLTRKDRPQGPGTLLLVGGVAYDKVPRPGGPAQRPGHRPAHGPRR